MNASFDIERELDRWLGPDEDRLPPRVLDAALARIETTAQRRGPTVPRRRTAHMSTLLRYGGAVAALLAIVAGSALLFGGQQRADRPTPTDPAASAAAVIPVTSPTATPTATPTVPPTPEPTAIWSSPPLGDRYVSESYGYSVAIPDGYTAAPAREAWDPEMTTDMASPWLERIYSPDYIMTFTARSTRLDRPMTTDEWLETFLASADAPAGLEVTCHPKDAWAPVPVGDTTGAFYLEPCGPLWAVVAAGDRGYVFTVSYSVMDTEVQSAPFVTTFKEMLAGMELTPETATLP